MVASWIVTVFVLFAAATSAAFYSHAGRAYAAGKSVAIPSPRSFHVVYRYIQATSILFTIAAQWSDHGALLKVFDATWAKYAGVGLSALGLAGFVWAKRSLGDAYSPCFDSLVPQSLVTTGPYRWVRHPIYVGNVALLAGMFLASGSLWLALNTVVLAAYYIRAALVEERALAERFPEYANL